MRSIFSGVASAAHRILTPLTTSLTRYVMAGILSTAVYFGLVITLVELFHRDPVVSSVLGFVITIVLSYFLNRQWVFVSARSHTFAFPSFVLATFISLSLNASIMHVTVHVMRWWYVVGLLITTAIVPPINFAMNYFWCFRAPRSSG